METGSAPFDDPSAVKRLRSLMRDAAARREAGSAVAEGPRLAHEALAAGVARRLWATRAALEAPGSKDLLSAARLQGLAVRALDDGLFNKLADTRTPQGWLCEVEIKALPPRPGATVFLALDGIQDPGNLGTLLRCAWAAGASVLLGGGCADAWSPKVLRAGAGAQFHTPLRECPDLAAALKELGAGGVRVYATAPRAPENYLQADCRGPVCWVLGSEGRGLGVPVQAACERIFRIAYPGDAESLNAAVSGAILLFETLRQRA